MFKIIIVFMILLAVLNASAVYAQTPGEIVLKASTIRKSVKVLSCELIIETQTHSRFNSKLERFQPSEPIKYSQSRIGIIDFDSGKYRWDIKGEEYSLQNRKVQSYSAAETFDGIMHRSIVYPQSSDTSVKPGSGVSADYGEFKGDLRSLGFPMEIRPLFMSFGVLPAARQQPLYPGQFHKYDVLANSDTLVIASNPTGPRLGIWLETVMLSSKTGDNKIHYCFDPKRDLSLIHVVEIVKGKIRSTTDIQYTKNDIGYIINGWVYKTQDGDIPIQTYNVKVNLISQKNRIDDSLFNLSPLPGMLVGKQQFNELDSESVKPPAMERFLVDPDGSLKPLGRQSTRYSYRVWIILALSIIATMVTGSYLFRKFFARSATTKDK